LVFRNAHAKNLSIHTAGRAAMTDDMCRVIVTQRPTYDLTYDLERNAAGVPPQDRCPDLKLPDQMKAANI
jgi:hypothetical protein